MRKLYLFILIVVSVLFLNTNNTFSQTNKVNLLGEAYNVSFENGETAPWQSWGGLTNSSAFAHSGTKSMYIDTDGEGGGPLHVSGLTGGKVYTVSAWIKGPRAQIAVATFKNDTVQVAPWLTTQDDTTSTNEWVQVFYSLDPLPEDCNAINIIIWAKSRVYVDEIGLVEGYDPLVSGGTTDGNLLDAAYNTGFETGEIAPWQSWGGLTVSSSVAHTGAKSMYIDTDGEGGGPMHVSGLVGGTVYTVSAWIKGPRAQIAVATFKNDTVQVAPWLTTQDDTTSTNEWVLKYYSLDPLPEDCNAINIIIWAKSRVYVDDIGLVTGYDPLGGGTKVRTISTESVKIYPNPCVNELNVSLTSANSKVAIYNSLGQKMTETIVTGTRATFDVSSYAKGMYFVKVNNGITQKFIK